MRRYFSYNKEDGMAQVTVVKQGFAGYGSAKLHPDDKKYGNEFTGLAIAEMRAEKNFLKNRARAKKKMYNRLQGMAKNYKTQYEEDEERQKLIDLLIESYIKEKSELYKKLEQPQKRVQWKSLPDNFFDEIGENKNEEPRALE